MERIKNDQMQEIRMCFQTYFNLYGTSPSEQEMLEWLGMRAGIGDMDKAAALIREAVDNVLRDGHLTADIGGNTSTSEFGDLTVKEIEKLLK